MLLVHKSNPLMPIQFIAFTLFFLAIAKSESSQCEYREGSKECVCSGTDTRTFTEQLGQLSECSKILLENCNLETVPEWYPPSAQGVENDLDIHYSIQYAHSIIFP